MKAIWNGKVIAESDKTYKIENNIYFPPEAVKKEHLRKSTHTTHCYWKGDASYFDVVVDGKVNENAAWYYPDPPEIVDRMKNYVAFWNGVEIID